MKKKTKSLNWIGGPGIGKSTQALDSASLLKKAKVKCELVTEYAKDLVWQGSYEVLANQIYVFAKQHQKMFRLRKKNDAIITDSPLITSLFYLDKHNEDFKDSYELFKGLVISEFNQYDNYNFLLKRETVYQEEGRYQNEEEAIEIDRKIKEFLEENKIPYIEVGLEEAVRISTSKILLDIYK